ncbi:MAG: type III ribulose-bisphosphate carboxylase [Candidatus ainarchaeum sp.]|nr:type III ribulose-bisphosphate carboxylase [Candidatus ainarchaeum sp.]
MNRAYSGYIDLSYSPSNADLVAEFLLEQGRGVSFSEAAQAIASESSIGTWTGISTMRPGISEMLAPTIFSLNPSSGTAKIAYPIRLFENGNIPQLLSSIAGNVFGMKEVKNLRLEDIDFPAEYIRAFKGPKFGIGGIRKILNIGRRPLLGTIIKPKLGLSPEEHAEVAFDAWIGGCDLVKDDENLSSMAFNNFERRVKATLAMRGRAERLTGERKAYLANISAPYKEMVRRAKFLKKQGNEYAMVDIVSIGWSALQSLRDENLGLILHAHRAGHAAFTRNPRHGISMLVLAKLCRLAGLDQLHIGAIFGKMEGRRFEVKKIGEEIEHKIVHKDFGAHMLSENWLGIKPMLAVCSGGLHPAKVPLLINALGNDIVIQMGGGIHGHPEGTVKGAIAARQAIEASLKGLSLREAAAMHSELRIALQKWQ